MTKAEILRIAQQEKVQFLRLQFTDILGQVKNVEIPSTQLSTALDGKIFFDGSSIEGFSRTREMDMVLVPDYSTFRVFPWTDDSGLNKIAVIICDIYYPDGREFEGCPRLALKKVVSEATAAGFDYKISSEVEFFLFRKNRDGEATLSTHDPAGYFDLTPDSLGEETRRHIVKSLETMNFKVVSSHHEVSPGQHEIDFAKEDAVTAADYISSCKYVVRKKASEFGLHATFMPKPIYTCNGSGLHINQVLEREGENKVYSAKSEHGVSKEALWFIGGQLVHSKGFCAITNPLINSYKRLVDGKEAPIYSTWSETTSAPLVRTSDHFKEDKKIELRLPDPTCNPYAAFAVILKAGLDGIKNKLDPGKPITKEISRISHREQARLKIDRLPKDLSEALNALKKDKVVQEALGEYIYKRFISAKQHEWNNYISQIHPWEIEQYFTYY